MARPRLNGKATKNTLKAAVGGLSLPPTERLELDTIWIDMIIPNQGNQLFRARILDLRERGYDLSDVKFDADSMIDADGKISEKMIDLIHTCFVHDWGDWDENGKAQPLYDDDGEVSPCSLENFKTVVRDFEGGDSLFLAIQGHVIKTTMGKIAKAEEEKNSSGTSRAPRSKVTRRSTRKGQKQARA